MSMELDIVSDVVKQNVLTDALGSFGVVMTPQGLVFERELSLDEYDKILDLLVRFEGYVKTVINYCQGDAYNRMFKKYGECVHQTTDRFGEGMYHQIRKRGYVAERIEFMRRRPNVKWSIYEELAPMPREFQDRFLARADRGESLSLASVKIEKKRFMEERAANQESMELPPAKPQWSGDKFGSVGDSIEEEIKQGEAPTIEYLPPDSGFDIIHEKEKYDPDDDIPDNTVPIIEHHIAITDEVHEMALKIAEAMTNMSRPKRLFTVGDVVDKLIRNQHRITFEKHYEH